MRKIFDSEKRYKMNTQETAECCPRLEPGPWDDKLITWEKKMFLRDRVLSFLHIPLNFGSVMKRSMATIEAAGAAPDEMVVLSDENSLWGADVYIAISKRRQIRTPDGGRYLDGNLVAEDDIPIQKVLKKYEVN